MFEGKRGNQIFNTFWKREAIRKNINQIFPDLYLNFNYSPLVF